MNDVTTIMSEKPPFPATGTYLKSIRESSKSLRESAGINASIYCGSGRWRGLIASIRSHKRRLNDW